VTVTLDTNILYQALYSRSGASYAILQLIRTGAIELALSVPVFEEYRQVLLRPRTQKETGRSRQEMETVLDFLALVGVVTPIHYLWRPNLPDAGDDMFVELAVASGSEYLITRNTPPLSDGRTGSRDPNRDAAGIPWTMEGQPWLRARGACLRSEFLSD
jgi:putative PIN family toxin of toxin-antitoxin system